jgi:hypothetical protein
VNAPLLMPLPIRRCWLNSRFTIGFLGCAGAVVWANVMAGAAVSAATSTSFISFMVFLLL